LGQDAFNVEIMDYDLDVTDDLYSERIQKEVHEYEEAV